MVYYSLIYYLPISSRSGYAGQAEAWPNKG